MVAWNPCCWLGRRGGGDCGQQVLGGRLDPSVSDATGSRQGGRGWGEEQDVVFFVFGIKRNTNTTTESLVNVNDSPKGCGSAGVAQEELGPHWDFIHHWTGSLWREGSGCPRRYSDVPGSHSTAR